jgi:predicted ABC-type ATPase
LRDLIVLGGPNGAGKTTAAQTVLPRNLEAVEFVNADEIARGLSSFNPEGAAYDAGRLMLERMSRLASGERDFAIETICSGRTRVRFLRECKRLGWRVTLVFLWLPSPEIALERIAKRVAEGGHFVSGEIVIRRYWAGLHNLLAHYFLWRILPPSVIMPTINPYRLPTEHRALSS